MSAAGWRHAETVTADEKNRLGVAACILAAEFRRFDFGTCATWDGPALIAVRKDRGAAPGVTAVITPDMDEMRAALLEDTPADPSG